VIRAVGLQDPRRGCSLSVRDRRLRIDEAIDTLSRTEVIDLAVGNLERARNGVPRLVYVVAPHAARSLGMYADACTSCSGVRVAQAIRICAASSCVMIFFPRPLPRIALVMCARCSTPLVSYTGRRSASAAPMSPVGSS